MTLYTDQALAALLNDEESQLVERKRSGADRSGIRKNICAFANDLPATGKPGVIFIGVEDDGICAGITVDDELLRILAQMRSDANILPLPTMTVEKKTIDGCEVAVIVVEPSASSPVRYQGRVWVKVGPTVQQATAEEEQRLVERRRAADLPFDMRPSSEGTNAPARIYWYADRIEIQSPGGLYGKVTPENIGIGATDYRNPLIAEIMHHLGFAQRFGMGLPLAKKSLADNGNPSPEFDFSPTHVAVTLRPAP
jgi:predicted HTH transcriptional regulator